jgi:hypothetical protein
MGSEQALQITRAMDYPKDKQFTLLKSIEDQMSGKPGDGHPPQIIELL